MVSFSDLGEPPLLLPFPPFLSLFHVIYFPSMLTKTCRRFWQACAEEAKKRSGNFSFWIGRRHIVGVTSSASRKLFYENPNLDLVSGAMLLPWGVHFWPPVHDIFRAGYAKGINNTYFLRRLMDFQTTTHLSNYFPRLRNDTRQGLEALMVDNSRAVMTPPSIWRLIFNQNNRLLVTDQIVDDPKLKARVHAAGDTLLHTYSPFNVQLPWLPSPSWLKRRLARVALERLAAELIDKRMKPGGPRYEDALQTMIDRGDRRDWIIEYCTSIIFIASTNAGVIAGQMLNIMAIYPEWQEKILQEIKAAVAAHSKDKTAPLVDQLSYIPMEVWENGFSTLYLCLKETMRMWVSFNASRMNTSTDPILIPGSDEVIPGNTFVVYNTTQCNFNPELYPNPTKFDPERHMEGRQEYMKEPNGCKYFAESRYEARSTDSLVSVQSLDGAKESIPAPECAGASCSSICL
jgi:sterol 14-demethylase